VPRARRINYEGAIYHVTSRGNERRKIVVDDGDRVQFLRVLADVVKDEKVVCHAWVLMDNHYHLLLETHAGNLSAAMKHLNGIYTQRFNRKHRRFGHLFQGRYKAIVVEKDTYLKELSLYVVLNPVRAMMVKSPGDWKWSSYRATAGLEKAEPWLETRWLLGQFGKTETQAHKGYRKFVAEGMGKKDSPWEELYSRIYLVCPRRVPIVDILISIFPACPETPLDCRSGFPGIAQVPISPDPPKQSIPLWRR
jgi:REP-associated tyrosine transposase